MDAKLADIYKEEHKEPEGTVTPETEGHTVRSPLNPRMSLLFNNNNKKNTK